MYIAEGVLRLPKRSGCTPFEVGFVASGSAKAVAGA